MSRGTIASPLSILVAGVVVVIMLLMGAGPRTSAVGNAQETTYPPATATALAIQAYLAPTLTAAALTQTSTSTPTNRSGRTTPTSTGTPSATGTVAAGTPTSTIDDEFLPETPEIAELATPTNTPTNTPTATPTGEMACAPGEPIDLAGSGPPHAAYLIYFGERAVGGGTVEADGTFGARLMMGLERAGRYEVTVRLRGTRQVLRSVTCNVPDVTPTAIPRVQ
jgi:hypothetical protein